MVNDQVGFIGGGQMATALLTGALRTGIFQPAQVVLIESVAQRREQLQGLFPGVKIGAKTDELRICRQLILAVKPNVLRDIGKELGKTLTDDRLWVSIAAGVSLEELADLLQSQRVIRVMPNTPAQVGAGAAALTAGEQVSEVDLRWVERLMSSVGSCCRVKQEQMHAVTALSGSGPAYIYMVIEAMADAGVLGGLPRDVSIKLAAQTVLGAAKMVLETGMHPGQLKDQVTSPAGTTIAGLRILESHRLRSAMIEAIQAANNRSRELEGPCR